MKITLFIPMKNEIEGLKAILPRIRNEWVDEIVFIDGNSTDGSFEYVSSLGYKIFRQKTDGICGAFWEGLEHSTGDALIAFSPDNNSIPELIPDVAAQLKNGYDMVVVSRYLNEATSEDDDPVTAFGNWLFTTAVNVLFRAKITDSLVIFRGFTRQLVTDLSLDEKKLPLFEMQLSIRSAKMKKKVLEIPGSEPKRIGGVRKMRPLYNGSAVLYLIIKEFFTGPRA
ncbi:MAG: glycosyltransferase family 2 protein [Pseudobdellovibrio sp.]